MIERNDKQKKLDAVRGWVNGQGYPFELRVAAQIEQVFRASVSHSVYWEDPVTSKMRETDILASDYAHSGGVENAGVILSIYVECKGHLGQKNKDVPGWVGMADAGHDPRKSKKANVSGFNAIASKTLLEEVGSGQGLAFDPVLVRPVVHSIHIAGNADLEKNDNDERTEQAFGAVSSVATGARVLSAKQNEEYKLTVAVVVTKFPQFIAYLDSQTDDMNVVEVGSLIVSMDNERSLPVFVVTMDELPGFLAELKEFHLRVTDALLAKKALPPAYRG